MYVIKTKNLSVSSLIVNENDEVKEVKILTYAIMLKAQEEYDSIKYLIEKSLFKNINVFEHKSFSYRLENDCNQILSSHDLIVVFETNKEDKFELLESMIKEFMIANKNYLS